MNASDHVFERGDLVALVADPVTRGVVTGRHIGASEVRYTVWHDNTAHSYYASQLTAVVSSPPVRTVLSLDAFNARLTALQLRHPGLAAIYSLHAARVTFIPYQFKPVLKLIRSDRPRLLIADEVGVGKTIEAGLILRELQARRDLHSVLVLCPKPLVTDHKWQRELKRFDETFTELDGPTLRHCLHEADLDGAWPVQHARTILPYSLLDQALLYGRGRRERGLLDLDPPPHFDLVICDEAHHLCNSATSIHRAARFFCDHADAVVFLSATPIQLASTDLFVLLQMLRPDLIIDPAAFRHMADPNPAINAAISAARTMREGWQKEAQQALLAAGETEWGRAVLCENPVYKQALRSLKSPVMASERLAFVRTVEELHTFAPLINRTRRRDIGAFTTRAPETVEIPFTLEQQTLHDALLETQKSLLARVHSTRSIPFLLTMLRRQAASCLHGLAPLLKDIFTRRLVSEIVDTDAEEEIEEEDLRRIARILQEEASMVLALAQSLGPDDPKRDALLALLQQKTRLPNPKVLVFSSFRHTLAYLLAHLHDVHLRVGLIQGSTDDEMRRDLRHRFSLPSAHPDALDVLLLLRGRLRRTRL